ncbi:MAG: hypothetical protein FWG03_00585 [Clostridiales bacterium]|nr:hypothetical protein [Clostridiales bacterium]
MKRKLEILITAGGTSEKIDDVRRITNSGTGRLGAMAAEAFAASGRDVNITYICSEGAVRPQIEGARVCEEGGLPASDGGGTLACDEGGPLVRLYIADDVRAVRDAVLRACNETAFDIIVHSMAIGDYQVRAVSDAGLMTGVVIERLSLLACGDSSSPEEAVRDALLSPPGFKEAKISSDKENLIVVLEKAPKIIALFRGLLPGAVIVGFKLLSGASEEELVRAGHGLLQKNDCDFVLANDMHTVRSGRHEGLLIARDGSFERAEGKGAIASLIVERTLERAGKSSPALLQE